MRHHISHLLPRMIRAGLRVKLCRYRVVAVAIDYRNRPIAIATNSPRFESRGRHAEEAVLLRSPKSVKRVLIARVSADGRLLPIEPCTQCLALATKVGAEIISISHPSDLGV